MEDNNDNNSNDKTSRFVGRCLIRLALWTILGPVLGEVGAVVLDVVSDLDTTS